MKTLNGETLWYRLRDDLPSWWEWPYGIAALGPSDFAQFQFRINNTIYDEPTEEFHDELSQLRMWAALGGDDES